jgi:hypothetical protein
MSDDTALSPDQKLALAGVLDEIIPPSRDRRLPGAGQLGLADALARNAELRPLLASGLAALDEIARARGAAGFAELASGERREALEGVATRAPGFLPILVVQTFVGYYRDGLVRGALGLENRPPFPRGYEVEPTDFSILDPVRRRDPIYRKP